MSDGNLGGLCTSFQDELSFLHFNDVYHISQSTALGRLSNVFRQAKAVLPADRPITVFSGDAFSPSLESAVLKGEHMVPVLNHLLVDVACYGNHDFDFGEETLVKLSRSCAFPWLLSNAVHADGRLLALAKEYLVLDKKGYRIGFFGLAGTDWPSNCQHLPADCTILDPVSVAKRISHFLRSTRDVDIIIAITHMRHEEDVLLAQSCDKEVDLILGGHDHEMAVHGNHIAASIDAVEGNIKLVKSGTDFRSYSKIRLGLSRQNGGVKLKHIKVSQVHDISLAKNLSEDSGVHTILSKLQARITDAVERPLFHTAVPLDGRTSVVRTQETNVGNMLADAVRAYYDADIAFVNSGSLRCDRIIDVGIVTVKDMIDIVPFDNPFVVKRVSGRAIVEALENAACDIIDGRFFQVSGITFNIDSHQPVNSRIHGVYIVPDHSCGTPFLRGRKVPLNDEHEYTVAMVAFIADGFDGYALFKNMPTVIGEEGAVTDSSFLMQVFQRDTPDVHGNETDIDRARAAIVLDTTADGLPLVSPTIQDRIQYVRYCK